MGSLGKVHRGCIFSWFQGYVEEKLQGECCGRCLPTACTIQLRGGQIVMLKVGPVEVKT